MTADPVAAQAVGQVEASLGRLSEAVSNLSKSNNDLEQRLKPVLRPPTEIDSVPTPPEPPYVDLAQRIEENRQIVEGVVNRNLDILQRIEL